jgi:WD40 repeat protein
VQTFAQQTTGNSVELKATLSGHTKKILDIKFSPGGQLLASSSEDQTVRLWRVATGEHIGTITSDKQSEPFMMEWSSDDSKLAITYRKTKVWKLVVWKIVWEISTTPRPLSRFTENFHWDLSPGGRKALVLDKEKVLLFDVITGKLITTLVPEFKKNDVPSPTVSFDADGQRILTTSVDGPTQVWEADTGKLIATYPGNRGYEGLIPFVPVVSPDKRFFISGNKDIFEVATGRPLTTIKSTDEPISFSPDGKTVLTVRYDPEDKRSHRQSYLTAWDIVSGGELSRFQVPEGIRDVYWSRDGKTLGLLGYEFHPRIVDVTTGRENGRVPSKNCWPWSLGWGSDGCEHLVFSADGTVLFQENEPIKLWASRNVSLITALKGAHMPAVFSPTDGRLLATRSKDKKSVLLWRLNV